jgi:hypothetical protein
MNTNTHARTSLRRKVRAFNRGTAAGPIVEFAIIVPVLLLLLFGIIDFARAFFQRNNLVAAAREGARYAAVLEAPCGNEALIRARVISYFSGVGSAAPANTEASIPITMDCTTPTSPTNIMVEIRNYPFNPITPLFGMLGQGAIQLRAQATYRWERSS